MPILVSKNDVFADLGHEIIHRLGGGGCGSIQARNRTTQYSFGDCLLLMHRVGGAKNTIAREKG